MRLHYFFCSFFYFTKLAFIKKHYSIIFYAPHHFNRGKNSENIFFKNLLDSCKTHNLSFLFLEEPDVYSNQKRSNIAVPFDFIYYLIVFLRKFMNSDVSYIDNDKKIGAFIRKIFFKNITFDNYITLSQSMLSFFNGVSSDAKQFDLQHGTVHAVKRSYLYNGKVSINLRENDVTLLLNGTGYKDILLKNDMSNYFQNHIQVIGASSVNDIPVSSLNKNVLVTLQFTHDHSEYENKLIADSLEIHIKKESSFHFYLKSHPRFNNEIDLSRFLSLPNVSLTSESLTDIFSKCSLHLTSYSTVTFEASLHAIPTCFLQLDPIKMRIFNTQYNYPFYNYLLSDLYNNYSFCSLEAQKWAKEFYQPFCEESFLKSLKNA